MHSELVSTMSTTISTITVPTLCGPSNVARSGTPMKPVLGKATTSAPKAASFQPRPRRLESATTSATSSSATSR